MTLDVRLTVNTLSPDLANRLTGAPQTTVLTFSDLAVCDEAFGVWIAALEAGSPPAGGRRRWMAAERVMLRVRVSKKRSGAVDVLLGVRASGAPWSVEVNAPRLVADSDGLSSVATDPSGRRYVIRQGYLRNNPDSDGDVSGDRFARLSGLTPVVIVDAPQDDGRDWYIVADLGAGDETIREQTGRFVDACDRARRLTREPQDGPEAARLFAGPEQGGSYLVAPIPAQPARAIRRLQGEVWLALEARLAASGIELRKPRHRAGYEADGFVTTSAGEVLIEIKTGCRAADVYEGLGQLLLYSAMLRLKLSRRILLLPGRPSEDLEAALRTCGVEVHPFGLDLTQEPVLVRFEPGFLAACGCGDGEGSELSIRSQFN